METEFSFFLQPSNIKGIGVFAAHDIPKGTPLFQKKCTLRKFKTKDVPPVFVKYLIHIDDEYSFGPERFDCIEVGWFINHSHDPNIAIRSKKNTPNQEQVINDTLYAIKDIKAGDELFVDYNYLGEPEHLKEDYYKK